MKVNHTSLTLSGDFNINDRVWNLILEGVNKAGCTVLATVHHNFYPQGFSGCVILAESHVAVHTYPESDRAYVSMATCGDEHLNHKITLELIKHWHVMIE